MTPIYKALLNYIKKDFSRFHMPGHKGKNIYNLNDLWKYDVTEIEGLDNLLNSQGIIKKTEELYQNIYNSKKSIISTQGSTLGIQTMLTAAVMATGQKTRKIIIDRNIHVSVINTLGLLDIKPIWIFHDQFVNKYMSGVISPKNVEKKILDNPDVNIIFITSPNYFGQILDIKSIYKVCKKYNKILLIDNAHGAHFKFISNNLHPSDCGCSCCCDSLHKTLPVLTGGALIHCFDDRMVKYMKKASRLYSSTSPSYLIMLSVDRLLGYINKDLESDYKYLLPKIKKLKLLAANLGFAVGKGNMDPIKFIIGPGDFNCNVKQIYQILKKYKVEPEYVNDYWVLLIFSAQNLDKDFKRVESAIKFMSKIFNKGKNVINYRQDYNNQYFYLKRGTSIREAILSKSHKVKTVDSEGKVCASSVITCPPCVPIIVPGEIVSRETINFLLERKIYYLDVIC